MGDCKIKATCTGTKTWAVCTQYESNVNSESSLDDSTCLNLEETTQDIYNQLDGINDLSELGEECLTYVLEEGKLLVKNVLLKHEQEICTLKTQIATLQTTNLCNTDITGCGLDLSCLVDACGNPINTFSQLVQAMIDKICEP